MKYFIFILVIGLASAELTIDKYVSDDDLQVGDEVIVSINLSNTFAQELHLQIQSRDVVGKTGVDVQCYELTIPHGSSTIQIAKIPTGVPGDYTIDKTKITYTNPQTSKEESIESNEVDITVTGTMSNVVQESITTVYECNGQSITSTSSSVTSTGQQQQDQENQQKMQNQQKMDQRLQQNQMSQDSKALQQQMEKDMEEQKQLESEFEQNLDKNQELQDMKKQLEDQGYQLKDKSLNPESNNTGDFQYNYEKGSENAQINGEMKDGDIQNLESRNSEHTKDLEEQLEQDPVYQQYVDELSSAGFNKTGFDYQLVGNVSKTATTFENPQGETANITADVDEKVENVKLNRKRDRNWWWLTLFLIPVIILVLLLRRKKPEPAPVVEQIFDYKSAAQEMLDAAEKLFKLKKYKDAYGKAGEALRLFYSHKYSDGNELTATDTLTLLKRKKLPYANASKSLSMCGLVEFAKYKPNKPDFNTIIDIAKKIIN